MLKDGDLCEIDDGTLSVRIENICSTPAGDCVTFIIITGPKRMLGKSFKASADEFRERMDGSVQLSPIELSGADLR
jgi:hypothetical protein